jgi:hypothetical protein
MYTPALNMLNPHSMYIRLAAKIMKYLRKCTDMDAFMYHELLMQGMRSCKVLLC